MSTPHAGPAAALRRLLAYRLNHVVRLDPPGPPADLPADLDFGPAGPADRATALAHPSASVRKAASFLDPWRQSFALRGPEGVRALAIYEDWQRFAGRAVVRLRPGEHALVELIVWPEHEGRGLARRIIALSAQALFAQGATGLVSWMWWSHGASLAAFERAGWKRCRFSVVLGPSKSGWLRLQLPAWMAPRPPSRA